VTSFHPTD